VGANSYFFLESPTLDVDCKVHKGQNFDILFVQVLPPSKLGFEVPTKKKKACTLEDPMDHEIFEKLPVNHAYFDLYFGEVSFDLNHRFVSKYIFSLN
jgi:hypothetical protein